MPVDVAVVTNLIFLNSRYFAPFNNMVGRCNAPLYVNTQVALSKPLMVILFVELAPGIEVRLKKLLYVPDDTFTVNGPLTPQTDSNEPSSCQDVTLVDESGNVGFNVTMPDKGVQKNVLMVSLILILSVMKLGFEDHALTEYNPSTDTKNEPNAVLTVSSGANVPDQVVPVIALVSTLQFKSTVESGAAPKFFNCTSTFTDENNETLLITGAVNLTNPASAAGTMNSYAPISGVALLKKPATSRCTSVFTLNALLLRESLPGVKGAFKRKVRNLGSAFVLLESNPVAVTQSESNVRLAAL